MSQTQGQVRIRAGRGSPQPYRTLTLPERSISRLNNTGCDIARFDYAISGPFDYVMMLVGKGPYPICKGLGLDTAPL
jgi:hypothetical protein